MKLPSLNQNAVLIGPAVGFLVWSAGFVGLYALQSVGCAFGWDQILLVGGMSLQRMQLVLAFLLLLSALALLVLVAARKPQGSAGKPHAFLHRLTAAGLLGALFASLFTFGPAIALSACNGLP